MADTSVELKIQLKAGRAFLESIFIYSFSCYLVFSSTFEHCQIQDMGLTRPMARSSVAALSPLVTVLSYKYVASQKVHRVSGVA